MTSGVGAIERQAINRNFLSQLDFKFLLYRCPNVTFFLQRVNIPGLNLQSAVQPNPFTNIPHSGDHIQFGPLSIEFKVDEDFANYIEISNWIRGLGFPEDYGQYKELKDGEQYLDRGIRSDISLMILNSTKNQNVEIIFHDCIPTSLSDLVFTTTDPDVDYIEALATFDYIWYEVIKSD